MMTRRFTTRVGQACGLAALLVLGGCGGDSPSGLGSRDQFSLSFIDGPADHVAGNAIPTFRVWVLDAFGRRATLLEGGTLTMDLLAPGGGVQTAGFATVSLSFGQGTVSSSTTLPMGDGYSVRARYENITLDSPPFSVVSGPDVVEMTNPTAGEAGLVVDGANNIVRLQDVPFKTRNTSVAVGVMKSGNLTHEVAAFASDRRPELVPVVWTPGIDTISIALRDPVGIPVTVWVITGNFATEKASVEAAIAGLNQVWRQERLGIVIDDIEFMDATSQSQDFEVFAIGLGAPFGPLANGVGRTGGRFNIYVVLDVRENGASVNGFGETSGTAIAVTSNALASIGARAMGHELGHNFGLRHTDGAEGFEAEGNMMNAAGGSTVLTEGQIFRVHFDQFTPLRAFRTGDTFPSRLCNPIEASTTCPALGLRVWSEDDPGS